MDPLFTSEISISLAESSAFARLSGDYNPLHLAPITARRTRYGQTVTHGVHLYLSALDAIAANGLFEGRSPSALSATFDDAVFTGDTFRLSANRDANRILLSATTRGRAVFSGSIELTDTQRFEPTQVDAEFSPDEPQQLDFPPSANEGSVPLKLSRVLLASLFPSLSQQQSTSWISDLIATTQLVGMLCPGMHSIYSGFRLRRIRDPVASGSMRYRVSGAVARFRLLRMEVFGALLSGTVEAFFRARPVEQRSIKEIVAAVHANLFSGHRALIIGGSRGLGELTAKIVAAGGADVTITFATGKDDADRVCAEIRELGPACTAHQIKIGADDPPNWLQDSQYTHIYFFASPQLLPNPGPWDAALFQKLANVYVTGFAALLHHVLSAQTDEAQTLSVLYPSSIFLTRPERGFIEYAVAKAAGESLCDQMEHDSRLRFSKPRLPRMRTDQTGALVGASAADPFPIMLDVIHQFHCEHSIR